MPTTPDPPPSRARRRRSQEHGTRAILDRFATGDPAETLRLDELLSGLGKRAFGMLLFVASLPAFIPIPGGGAIAGPLIVLIGLQLLVGIGLQLTGPLSQPRTYRIGIHHDPQVGFAGEVFYERGFA